MTTGIFAAFPVYSEPRLSAMMTVFQSLLTRLNLTLPLLLVLPLLTSCGPGGCPEDQNLDVQLTEQVRNWTRYGLNDQVTLTNGAVDQTLTVTAYTEKFEPTAAGDECPEGKSEVIESEITGDLLQFPLSVRLQGGEVVFFQYDNSTWSYLESTRWTSESITYHASHTVGQTTYQDVLVITCDTCSGLDELTFAKSLGVVAIKTDTDLWVRK